VLLQASLPVMTLELQCVVPPSVPGGMAVGATPSGVPPDVAASNDSGAAVWCTP
jgi:hypothetical protein